MNISSGLNTKTALEHLIFLSGKNTVTVSKELEITPQQFTDWIKLRRPVPQERLTQIEEYFDIPARLLVDDKRYVRRLSTLDRVTLELLVVTNQAQSSLAADEKEELEYRISQLETEQKKQLRIARLSAILENGDEALMKKIDSFLDELEEDI